MLVGNFNSNLDIVSKTGRFSTTKRKLSLLSRGVSELADEQIVLSFIKQGSITHIHRQYGITWN